MALKALFISVGDLKKKSIVDGNVDSDKIVQYIEIAQDIHIQNYLGGSLYKKIQSLIIEETINEDVNVNYKLLLDEYVKPMLIWYTQATYIPYSMFQVNNGGLFKHRGENSDTATKEEMEYLVQRTRDTAEFYTKRFLDYICNYSNLFPEYTNNANEDMYPDKDVNYTGGWFV
tara:strand:- start:83 stop:601 length:519 start_codon:yes stop_codon:yes gene_type:complete